MDERIEQRLEEVRQLAEDLHPEQIEVEIGRARVEAYRDGMKFAADYIEHGPPRPSGSGPNIPTPRI